MPRPFFRPPRRLRFHRAGWIVSTAAVVLGLAAMATGNNLLYLLLGAILGLIALSGWLSELTLRCVRVERRVPHGIEAGVTSRIRYEVSKEKALLPSFALEVGERESPARGFVPSLAPESVHLATVEREWPRRGVYPLETITLATSFPFGFFRKERDLERRGEVVVWPRTDRLVREPHPAGDRAIRSGELAAGLSAARGEYRSLRSYRPGDDPRDVHWRSSARLGEPVVREYVREQALTTWLCLDLRGRDHTGTSLDDASDSPEEVAVEIAAALAARAAARGEPFGLATPAERVEQGTGHSQLARVLDVLARARFREDAPLPSPPAPPDACVLITAAADLGGAGWGDVYPASEAG